MKMLGLYLEQQNEHRVESDWQPINSEAKKYAFIFFHLNQPKSDFNSLSLLVNVLLGLTLALSGEIKALPGSYEPQSTCGHRPLLWSVSHAWGMRLFTATKNCSLLPIQFSKPAA